MGRTDHFQDITIAGNISVSATTQFLPALMNVEQLNNIRFATQFEGGNAGSKIVGAITDLPSTGGIVIADFEGAQAISQDIFSGVTKPVTLYLGVGTYTITGTASTNFISLVDNCRIIGSGRSQTIIRVDTTKGFRIFNINGDDCEIAHMSFTGAGTGLISQVVRVATGKKRAWIHDLEFDEVKQPTGGRVVWLDDCSFCIVENLWVKPLTTTTVHGVVALNDTAANDYHIFNNITVEEGAFGFNLSSSSRNRISNVYCFASTFTNTLEGFNVSDSDDNVFTNIGAFGRGDGGFVESTVVATCNRNVINGAVFGLNKLDGLTINSNNGTYSNIISFNNGQDPVDTNDGIGVNTSASGASIFNSRCYDDQGTKTQAFSLDVRASATDTRIFSSVLEESSLGDVRDNGTNTVIGPYATDNSAGATVVGTELELDGDLNHDGTNLGFYGTAPVTQQTGVAVSSAGIHAALVNLGLITA